jgi:hypothetical protein
MAAGEAAAEDALAAGDYLDEAITIAGEVAANRTIAAGGSIEDAEVAREAAETAVRDSQAAEEEKAATAGVVIPSSSDINVLAGAGVGGAFVVLLLLVLAAKFVQMKRKREQDTNKKEGISEGGNNESWETFPTRRATRNFTNTFSRFNTGEEGVNPLAEQAHAAQELRSCRSAAQVIARKEEEAKVAAEAEAKVEAEAEAEAEEKAKVAAEAEAEAKMEEEAKVAADMAASVMVEEVNPMHQVKANDGQDEAKEQEVQQELQIPQVTNPMHIEGASPLPSAETKPRGRSPSCENENDMHKSLPHVTSSLVSTSSYSLSHVIRWL